VEGRLIDAIRKKNSEVGTPAPLLSVALRESTASGGRWIGFLHLLTGYRLGL
jgi:hypothetical protein